MAESLEYAKVGDRRAFFVEEVYGEGEHPAFSPHIPNLRVHCSSVYNMSFHKGDIPSGFKGIVVAKCTHSKRGWVSIWKVISGGNVNE